MSTSSLGGACSASHSMLGVGDESGAETASVSARSSMYFSDGDGESGVSDGYGGDLESLYGYVEYHHINLDLKPFFVLSKIIPKS